MINTLYVKRRVVNAIDIREWMIDNRFTTMMDPLELHVTIAYSRTVVEWPTPETRMLIIPQLTTKLKQLGDKGALVLAFDNVDLTNRWQDFIKAGASWDWPEYQPHITITYQEQPNVNFKTIKPYSGPLILGHEEFEQPHTEFEPNEETILPRK